MRSPICPSSKAKGSRRRGVEIGQHMFSWFGIVPPGCSYPWIEPRRVVIRPCAAGIEVLAHRGLQRGVRAVVHPRPRDGYIPQRRSTNAKRSSGREVSRPRPKSCGASGLLPAQRHERPDPRESNLAFELRIESSRPRFPVAPATGQHHRTQKQPPTTPEHAGPIVCHAAARHARSNCDAATSCRVEQVLATAGPAMHLAMACPAPPINGPSLMVAR
ncbi:MAG: hypothetical protein KatS3mg077_2223 [Candidatus Binatia bacterium]|nr:MAG: hypothetical protein KatS3mg077_2223 [Candidatus Binatia bacterium]